MSRGQVAAKVAATKEQHPERFCPVHRCLWNTARAGGGYCPRHQHLAPTSAPQESENHAA
jgi:hypothetical protein